MRVYIKDEKKTVAVRLYGMNGKECTRRYFDTFFHDVKEVHETTDEERELSGTDAEYTIDEGRLFAARFRRAEGYCGRWRRSRTRLAQGG